MYRTITALIFGLLLISGCSQSEEKNTIDEEDKAPVEEYTFSTGSFSSGNITLPYRAADIAASSDGKAITVIYLHGGTSKGDDNEKQIQEDGVQAIASYLARHNMKATLIAPQCPETKSWIGTMLGVLRGLTDTYATRSDHDATRTYIFGGSMGGTGTWNMLSEYPDLFAAAMPVAGNPTGLDAEAVAQTPFYTVMGTADVIMSISAVQDFLQEADRYGAVYLMDTEKGWTHENTCKMSYTDTRLDWVFAHTKKQ